ncbi:MAG: tRNA adenosine(34) deaminase TadA [Gammaproteobacteria bacterium]|nr:tRNA adenosine(34) deaminase TadA [Gammaproteobacteria bacterium]
MDEEPNVDHVDYMRIALSEAELAYAKDEVPIGACVVVDSEVVGRGFNHPIGGNDPTLHAEIVALRDASEHLGNYRLPNASLYVTVEPCLMCVGAMIHARIDNLIYGVEEPKSGAVRSQVEAVDFPFHNHRISVCSGILSDDCRNLMQRFFAKRR